jgi:DNA topoisomerase III
MKLSQKALNYLSELQTKGVNWFEDTDKKFVCLYEKPSQVKAIKPVMGPAKETRHIKNISLAGHTMRLKNFDEYDRSLKDKSWYKMVKDKDLPMIPDEYQMVVKEKAKGKFRTDYEEMVNSAKRAFKDVDYIVLCTDPDNEGCALGLEVIYECKAEDKVIGMINMSKLDFFSLQEEIKHLDKIPFWEMAEAGFARGEFDWAFGLNNTILASVLLGSGQTYHVGGVKSPVIRMVVDRMKHIDEFKPVKYWQFHGTANHKKTNTEFNYIVKVKQDDKEIVETQDQIKSLEMKLNGMDKDDPELSGEIGELYGALGKLRWKLNEYVKEFESSERDIFSKKARKQIEDAIKEKMTFKVTNFENKKGLTQNPPLAYSLTDLQAEAGNLHNFTPAKTLQMAQKLYEGQWQSYPRTDNRYYASGEMANIKKIVPNLLGLTSFANVNIPTPYKVKTGVFNSAKVTAHTGLAPTTKEIKDNSISGELKTIYDMVATRYLIQFMNKFEYYQVKLDVDVDAEVYITTFQNVEVKQGWRELYNPANMYGFTYVQKQTLPNMLIGDEIEIVTIERDNLATKPKPMFSDFSLLKGMENISRIYPELEGLEKGIGTPATRASILDQLFKSKYLVKKGRVIVASEKAKRLMGLLPDDMTSPKLRADMEAKLHEIIEGTFTRADYEVEFRDMIELQTQQLYEIAKHHKIETIDKATLPPSEAQLKFARQMAKELKLTIPKEAIELKDNMTKWLKKHEKDMPIMLSEKQYNFLKEYGQDDEKIVAALESHDKKEMTKEQKFEAGKWLGTYMRTSEYQKKRAKKAAATRKRNREAKMIAMGIDPNAIPVKKKTVKKKSTKKKTVKKKAVKK